MPRLPEGRLFHPDRVWRRMPSDGVYKMLEVVGTSKKSFADATSNAVKRAAKTLRNLDWFEVKELRGAIKDGKVSTYQAKISIGFRLDDSE